MRIAAALLALATTAAAAPPPPAPPVGTHLVSRSHLFALTDNAVAYVPASASLHPPLLVLLHGARPHELDMVQHFARGLVLLAPSDFRGGPRTL